jgi:hypothetical protein
MLFKKHYKIMTKRLTDLSAKIFAKKKIKAKLLNLSVFEA